MFANFGAALVKLVPKKRIKITFTLSNDCENLFGGNFCYEFAGFSRSKRDFCNAYQKINRSAIGKKLGYIGGETRIPVYRLDLSGGEYVLVRGNLDSWDIFRRVS
ncbi:MAG: hypothetical protein IJL87_02765 [Clostridia bacterium]|nr:hypothetical protein [Clostridia bacterium]